MNSGAYMNCRTQKWFIPELDFFESPVLKGSSYHVIYVRYKILLSLTVRLVTLLRFFKVARQTESGFKNGLRVS